MKHSSQNFFSNVNLLLLSLIIIFLIVIIVQNIFLNKYYQKLTKNLDFFKQSQENERKELKNQLDLLREELIRYKSQQEGRDQILALTIKENDSSKKNNPQEGNPEINLSPTSSANLKVLGIVKLKNKWSKADVFQEAKASSKIIGQIVQDKLYFFNEKINGWYKIDYGLGEYGWIQSSIVDEI